MYYRPPVDSLYENFVNLFSSQMNTPNRCFYNLLNCSDWFSTSLILFLINKLHFYDTTNGYILNPLITKPTRISNQPQTLIDNIFVSDPHSTVAGIFTFDLCGISSSFRYFQEFFEQFNIKKTIWYRFSYGVTLAFFLIPSLKIISLIC